MMRKFFTLLLLIETVFPAVSFAEGQPVDPFNVTTQTTKNTYDPVASSANAHPFANSINALVPGNSERGLAEGDHVVYGSVTELVSPKMPQTHH